jgi:hypothetical protein
MPSSETALTIVAYQIGTNNLLGQLRGYSYDPAPVYADDDPVNIANPRRVLAKRQPVVRATHILQSGSAAATNLSVTLFDVAGASYLGSLRSLSVDVRNEAAEASGLADLVWFGQLVKSETTITGQLIVPTATTLHALLQKSYSSTAGDHIVAGAVTIAGEAITGNFAISAKASGNSGQLQTLDVELKSSGNLTGPTGTSLLAVAMTGTAAVDLHLDTGFGKLGTTAARIPAIITSVRIDVQDAQVISAEYEFRLQASENLAASAS